MSTDTPRTDSRYVRGFDALRITNDEEQWVRADFARQLERELAAEQEKCKRLREALTMLHDNFAEYGRINNIGGYDNHDMRLARATLEATK